MLSSPCRTAAPPRLKRGSWTLALLFLVASLLEREGAQGFYVKGNQTKLDAKKPVFRIVSFAKAKKSSFEKPFVPY